MPQLPPENLATCNGLQICYQQFGPEDGEPLVFIMGLGAQMVFWPMPLLQELANRGYRIIRFDNRDIGHSEKLRSSKRRNGLLSMARYMLRLKVDAAYTLDDMVDDTIALLDQLNIERAHIIGASMGGMIAQLTAASHPERVKSLTSIMSNTNSPWLPMPKPSALWALIGPRQQPTNREQYLVMGRNLMSKIGGTHPQDELIDEMMSESWERGINPRGVVQQFMGIMATGDFTSRLSQISCPTTIIHGAADPLLRPAGGKASAKAIRGAELHLIKGMGHDLPPAVIPQVADLIDANVQKATV